jgi:hypothetical protein
MFYPLGRGPTTFKFPDEGKLRIEGCATKEDLAHPAEFDSEGQRCLVVGKDGNTTNLTVGRYAGLVSFTQNEVGIESVELGIYNSGDKSVEVFYAKGDSGSLVWHTKNGKAHIVGQLHSGWNKGGSTSNHVTYCTPGWPDQGKVQVRRLLPHHLVSLKGGGNNSILVLKLHGMAHGNVTQQYRREIINILYTRTHNRTMNARAIEGGK